MSDSFLSTKLAHVSIAGGAMAWLVCISAGLFFFYEFFQLNLFDVINESLRIEFHIDAASLAWMSSSFLWANIIFLLPAGFILDCCSARKTILVTMFICVSSTIGFALSHSLAMASFFHFLTGIGNAFCFLSCVVLVSRWFPSRRQALVIGCVVTLAFLGGMVAHTPLAYLALRHGWRYALLVDGGVGVLLFCWIFLIISDHPKACVAADSKPIPRISSNFLEALTNSQNWLAGIYTCSLNLPVMVLCALWGDSYLQVVHHVSHISASNIVSLIFLGSIFGCPLVGWFSDRSGRRKPLMVCAAVGALLVIILLLSTPLLSCLSLSLIFFSLGLLTSAQIISYPVIAESNSVANTGVATGIASVIIMGGAAIAQILFSYLMQYHQNTAIIHYTAANFRFAMWIFPWTIMVALIAVTFMRETYCEHQI